MKNQEEAAALRKQRVVIIGAGVAGLAAALRLAEDERFEVVCLEREAEPGGLARSLRLGEFTTDLGPHRIYSEDPEIMRFIREVAAPSMITAKRVSHMFLRGGFLKYPPEPLGLAARLGPLRLARFAASFALERLRPAAQPETYASMMRRAFGPALYEFLLGPFSAKTWKIDPAELHADTARTRISAGNLGRMARGLLGRARPGEAISLKELFYVRGGTQTLVRHLAEKAAACGVRLELGAAARALTLSGEGSVAAVEAQTPGGPVSFAADCVLSTAPLPDLLGLLPQEPPRLADAREAASGLEFLDLIFVCLIVRRPRVSADTWLYFPEPRFVFNRAYEPKNFDPTLGPPDRSLLCLEVTRRHGEAAAAEPDEALVERVAEQFCSTGLARREEIERGVVFRMPNAYPLYTLDYRARLDRVLAGLASIGNLVTLGRQGLFIHNNMDHSIAQGLAAGELLRSGPLETAAARWLAQQDCLRNIRIVD